MFSASASSETPSLQEQLDVLRRQLEQLGMNHRVLTNKVNGNSERLAGHQNWLADMHAEIADVKRALGMVSAKAAQLDGRVESLEGDGAALSDARVRIRKLEDIAVRHDGRLASAALTVAQSEAIQGLLRRIKQLEENQAHHGQALDAFNRFARTHNEITQSAQSRIGGQEEAMTDVEARVADLEAAVFDDDEAENEDEEPAEDLVEENGFSVPFGPRYSITSVKYRSANGDWVELRSVPAGGEIETPLPPEKMGPAVSLDGLSRDVGPIRVVAPSPPQIDHSADAAAQAFREQIDAVLRNAGLFNEPASVPKATGQWLADTWFRTSPSRPKRCANGCCPVCEARGNPCHKCGNAPAAK